MSGNGIVLLVIATLAAFTGTAWERARRSSRDLQRTTKAVSMLRSTAQKEQGKALLYMALTAVFLYYVARNG